MDEGRIEQLEKMFPNGFLILVPRSLEKTPQTRRFPAARLLCTGPMVNRGRQGAGEMF